jgi:putative membrane protein
MRKLRILRRLQGESGIAYQRLANLSGKKFDAAYIKVMVSDHDKTVRAFEEASASVKDPRVKGFVDKTLPVLGQHQQQRPVGWSDGACAAP